MRKHAYLKRNESYASLRSGAVRVKIFESVLLVVSLGLGSGCATSPKEPPAGSITSPPLVVEHSAPPASASPPPVAAASASAATPPPAAPESATGSAYVGCGEAIPVAKLWDETTESQVLEAMSAAKACAREHGRRLLLEFVAPWCDDCQEMAKLDEAPAVAQTMRERFERVRINVGKWDRHEALRESFGVRALATYIVIDPKTSKQLAKTTLEPITKPGKKLTAEDWRRWLARY